MAIPVLPIILAVAGLASGVAKGVSSVQNTKAEAKLAKVQAEEQMKERQRDAVKLMSQQKNSFLKGNVYFDGTPSDVVDETYQFMQQDLNTLQKNANTNIKNIMRQGRTAFATSIMNGLTDGLMGYAQGAQMTGQYNDNQTTKKTDKLVGNFDVNNNAYTVA